MENQQTNYQFSGGSTGGKNSDSKDIGLIDYLLVLWKRKVSIIIIFVVVIAIALVLSFVAPETYQAESLLKIGTFRNIPIVSINDMKAVFYSDNMLEEINEKVGLNKENIKSIENIFNINQKKTSDKDGMANYIQITAKGGSPEQAQHIVNVIDDLILQRYEFLFKEAEERFNLEVELIKREQEQTQNKIAIKEQEIKRLDEDINFYEIEISKRSDAQSEGQGRITESYINLLASAKDQKEKDLSELANLKLALINFDAKFQEKNFEKKYETRPTTVEVEPLLPKERISPDRRKNVTFSAILALFLGVLWAFAAEYIAKNKNEFTKLSKKNKDSLNF